jgi:hypothetical protein
VCVLILLSAIGKRRGQEPEPVAAPAADTHGLGGIPVDSAGSAVAPVPIATGQTDGTRASAAPAVAPEPLDEAQSPPAKQPLAKPESGDTDAQSRRERLASLQDRLRREPRNREAWAELREAIDEHERLARQAVRDGDYNAAEKYVLDMLKVAPNNRKLKEALDDVRKAKRGKPDRRDKD